MTVDEAVALGAAALRAEDQRRRELPPKLAARPWCATSDRYEVAARLVVEALGVGR